MTYALGYLQNAADERRAAACASTPNVREKHLKAASRWETLAAEISRQFAPLKLWLFFWRALPRAPATLIMVNLELRLRSNLRINLCPVHFSCSFLHWLELSGSSLDGPTQKPCWKQKRKVAASAI